MDDQLCHERHKRVDERLGRNENNIGKLFECVTQIRDDLTRRLPVWATLLLTLVFLLLGASLTKALGK